MSSEAAERKVVVMVRRARRLPCHRVSLTNQSYVSMRVVEKFITPLSDHEDLSKGSMLKRAALIDVGARPGGGTLSALEEAARQSLLTDAGKPLEEWRHVERYLGGGKERRSKIIRYTSDPVFEDMVLFDDLGDIPYFYCSTNRARSEAAVTTTAGTPRLQLVAVRDTRGVKAPLRVGESGEVRKSANISRAYAEERALSRVEEMLIKDRRYFLEVEVRDVTTISGDGELVGRAEVQLDTLPMMQQTPHELSLSLARPRLPGGHEPFVFPARVEMLTEIPPTGVVGPLEVSNGTVRIDPSGLRHRVTMVEDETLLPKVELIIEPVNFGSVPTSASIAAAWRLSSGEQVADGAPIWSIINDELSTFFTEPLLRHLFDALMHFDGLGTRHGLSRGDMQELLQGMYTFTGTPTPTDAELSDEMRYLFSTFDRDQDELLTVQEVCAMLKGSRLRSEMKPRWKPTIGATASSKAAEYVDTSKVAGCLWEGSVPSPYSYSGYRRPNGSLHDASCRPTPTSLNKLARYDVPQYRDLYDEVYGDETKPRNVDGTIMFPKVVDGATVFEDGSPHKKSAGSFADLDKTRAAREENTTIPLFERQRPLNVPFKPLSEFREEAERTALSSVFSMHKHHRRPDDPDLPRTAGERILGAVVSSVFLNSCIVAKSHLVGCRISSGTYDDCSFESCIISAGACITGAHPLRTSILENVKILSSNVVNCTLTRCVVTDCKVLVGQCSLFACRVRETVLSHCFLNEADIDATVRDGGANVFEGCRIEDIPKLSYAERVLNL